MPLYQYEPAGEGCAFCRSGFEWFQSINDPPLAECPTCKKAVRKCIATVNTPKISRKPSVSEMKRAGFHVLKKSGKGVYEKL
ncbi:MAG: zinc ribbon domain-containing protein [bacterium]